jgi:peroxiredoxin
MTDTSTSATIADQVAGMRANPARSLPPDVAAAFGRWVAQLTAAGVPSGAAQAGATLSDVHMLDAHGTETSLHAVTTGRPTVIVFYRGAWCPYCNLALRSYRDQLHPALAGRGIGLIAVSPQKPDGSLSAQERNDLPFPVLSDPGNVLAGQLGILLPARTDELRIAQEKLGTDLHEVNADGTENLPMPTVVLVDAEHQIRWIDIHPDYTTRTEVADILAGADSSLRAR